MVYMVIFIHVTGEFLLSTLKFWSIDFYIIHYQTSGEKLKISGETFSQHYQYQIVGSIWSS